MTFRLITHTSSIDTAPGETATGRVEIHNDGATSAVYSIEVVGLDAGGAVGPSPTPLRVPIDSGQSAIVDVPVVVPRTLGIGQHAAAFEVASSRADDRPALTPFTLSIASVSRVELIATPSTIRARRRADFHLDVTNNEALPVDVAVTGEAPDVQVAFTPSAFTLQPGQRAVAKGRVRGPRHWSGEPTQHNLLITARGRASSTTLTTPYVQRPLFAHRMRMVLAGITVVALWLAAIGGVAFWLASRDSGSDASAAIIGVDTDGDGIIDAFRDAEGNVIIGTDTDGDGIADSFVDADGNVIAGTDTDGDGIPDTLTTIDGKPIRAIDTDGDGIPDALTDGSKPPDDEQDVAAEPAATIVRGTITLDGDATDATDVAIALTPITLGAASDPAAPIGLRHAEPAPTGAKFWPIRQGSLNELVGQGTRRTLSIAPTATQPNADGVWLFTDVLQGQSYELSFSKAGYDTQSFVVTPAEDGAPIDMDVDLSPARGSLSGTVNGPSGVLGGAAITITDGTLEFQTTSDSRTGAWSIEGVSTPGIYTMSAVLRGYATAVRQVELTPGQQSSGITLQMQPGLGTLTGHIVDAAGTPVGGVTVTASNGDTTLRSTSLTQGDIGFFSLPQLAVPATYTVTAELEGYVTQSRRVPTNGNVGGIDFTMTSETITLSGRVMSSAGGGVESAGLIISTGDLQFRSSTSAAPNAGIFSIDRLPPGTYTITVEHYQHESATEFITVRAGETPPPLDLTLQRTTGPTKIGMGSLSVKVVNNDVTGAPIEGATVTIKRNRTADAPRTLQGGNALGVTFDEVTVGTYTVLVTKEGFNASQPTIVSVGLNHQEVTVRLQALGSASGTIVDSRTGAILDDYVVTLQQVDAAGNPIGATFGPFVPNDTDQIWSTDSRSLLPTGTYRITVNTPPLGYRVSTTQTPVVDPPEYALSSMRFNVPVVTNRSVPALSVQVSADPYPTITGRVFAPLWTNGQVAYTEIDDDSLSVVATCNGTAVQNITYSSNGGNAALRDEYTIDKADIAAVVPPADLPATCDIQVTANGRVTGEATGVTITPSNGNNDPDLLVATALVKPAPPLEGTVFWRDATAAPGARVVPLDTAIATSSPGEAITGFVSTVAPMSAPDTRPSYETDVTTGKITATSVRTDSGRWTAPTDATTRPQVFGASTYTFLSDNFQTGSVQFLIDESATFKVVDGSESSTVVTQDADGFAVELRPPDKGSIGGTVRIDSTTREYPTNMVSATGVGSTPVPPTTPDASGAFSFLDVDAGTWTVSFDTPPNHVLIAPTGGSVSRRVEPGTPTTGFDAHFVEQGAIAVRLFDKFGTQDQITPAATITLWSGGVEIPVTVAPVDSDGVYRITGIPVDASDPEGTAVDYRLQVSIDGYDMKRAVLDGVSVDAGAITVPMVAGRVRNIDLSISEYRTITTALVGKPSADVTEPLWNGNGATVTVTRLSADEGDPDVTVRTLADGTVTITGAPGVYRVAPAHPEYQTASVVPAEPAEAADYPAIVGTGIYVLPADSDVDLGAFEFELRPGTLSIEAVTQLTDGTAVTGATYTLYPGTATCTANAVGTPLPVTPISVQPGVYCLAVSKLRSVGPPVVHDAFPAIIKFTIPRDTEATPSTTTVRAPLPSLQPSLVGRLVAENALGEPITLVAAPAPTITRRFTSDVGAVVNSVPATNLAVDPVNTGPGTGTSVVASPPADASVDPSWRYTFIDVPYGVNEITAPSIAGYTPTEARVKLTTTTAFGPMQIEDFVYVAASSTVAIDIGPGPFPSLDPAQPTYDPTRRAGVTLTAPNGTTTYGTSYTFQTTTTPATNWIVIPDVAPANGNFRLQFDDALHQAVNQQFAISQTLVAGRRQAAITAPTGDRVRLTGRALQQNGADASDDVIPLATGATITVSGTPAYTLSPGDAPSAAAGFIDGTSYFIDVVPGTRNVRLTQTNYEELNLNNVPMTSGGTIVTRDLQIRMNARVVVTTYTGEENTAGLANPSPFNVRLRRTGTLTDVAPIESVVADPNAPTPVLSGRYVFVVPAGEYDIRATSTSAASTYPDQVITNQTYEVGSGWATDQTVKVPLPRYVDVTVSPADATVTIGTAVPAVSGALRRFSDAGSSGIPSTGEINNGTVTATGYRSQNLATIPAQIYTSRSVTLYPLVTVSGTIAGASVGTGTITATRTSPAATKTGDITTVGSMSTYRFTDLDVGTWTVTYAEQGVGTTSAPVEIITITDQLPASGTAAGAAITLTPRDVNFDFTVNRAGPGASTTDLGGATVSIFSGNTPLRSGSTTDDVPGPPDTTGTRRLTIAENAAPTRWTITHPEFLEHRGNITSFSLTGNTIPTWTMRPAVKGAVTGGTNPLITICSGTLTTICDTPAVPAFAATGGTFTYNGVLADGTYTVFATATGLSGLQTLTVGTAARVDLAITMAA